jgi:ankyrin repeat protein
MSNDQKMIKTPLHHHTDFYRTAMWFMRDICSSNADLFKRIVPATDDVKVLANLCLVSKDWANFFFGTLQGRKVWLETASRATGFNAEKIINPIVTDFRYQIKLLVCPWATSQTPLHFELPESSETTRTLVQLCRCEKNPNTSTIMFSAFTPPTQRDEDDSDIEAGDPCFILFSGDPNKSKEEFDKTVETLSDVPDKIYNLNTPDIDSQLIQQVESRTTIPANECKELQTRPVHKTAYAIMGTDDGFEGSIYFMSSRDKENPKFLRRVIVNHLSYYLDCDLCAYAQNIWILTNDGVVHMGRKSNPAALVWDGEDRNIGRMDPALWMAGKGEAENAIQFLHALGLDINSPSPVKKQTLIFHAVYWKQPEAVKTLIAARANVNHENSRGFTPLALAVEMMNVECVRILCANGATEYTTTQKNTSPLSLIGKGDAETTIQILDLLFRAGADPNETNADGQTLLLRPAILKEPTVFRFLLKNGCDPMRRDNEGNTMLHRCQNMDIMRDIVQNLGIDINAQNNKGCTALNLNIFGRTPAEVKIMVEELKADPNIKNHRGVTAYQSFKKFGPGVLPGELQKFNEMCALLLQFAA